MEAECPHCGSKLKAREEYQGKRVRCSKCRQIFVISIGSTEKTSASKQTDDDFWSIINQPEEGGGPVEEEEATTETSNPRVSTNDVPPAEKSDVEERVIGRDEDFRVTCKKCGHRFIPRRPKSLDLRPKDQAWFTYWLCPKCRTKNPNLLRHCRHIAILFIISAIITIISVNKTGVHSTTKVLNYGIVALQIMAILAIYSTRQPWRSIAVVSLVWIVIGIKLFFAGAVMLFGQSDVPPTERLFMTVGLLLLFGTYFFWVLHAGPKKYVTS